MANHAVDLNNSMGRVLVNQEDNCLCYPSSVHLEEGDVVADKLFCGWQPN